MEKKEDINLRDRKKFIYNDEKSREFIMLFGDWSKEVETIHLFSHVDDQIENCNHNKGGSLIQGKLFESGWLIRFGYFVRFI